MGRALPVVLAVLVAGCGLKTAPRPLEEVLPAGPAPQAWQREGTLMLAWNVVAAGEAEPFGGVRGHELVVEQWRPECWDCEPVATRIRLASGSAGYERQGLRAFYELPLPPQADRLRIAVRTDFGVGISPPGPAVPVLRAGSIPVPELGWRVVGAPAERGSGAANGLRTVQFYWEAPLERIVQVIGADGQPREQVATYRANLYRRIAPMPFPRAPLNGEPLRVSQLTVPPLQVEFPADARGEAYALRYVDRSGNEGPASPEVLIPLPGRRP